MHRFDGLMHAGFPCARRRAAGAAGEATCSYNPAAHAGPDWASGKECPMKILMWILLVIFLIGLAVVLGLGSIIF